MITDYSRLIKEYLESEGISNVYAGGEKEPSSHIPQDAVFCVEYGGARPDSMFHTRKQIHQVLVQVLIRGNPRDEEGTLEVARQVYNVLRNATPGNVMVIRPNAPPIRLGVDKDKVHRYTVNITIYNVE